MLSYRHSNAQPSNKRNQDRFLQSFPVVSHEVHRQLLVRESTLDGEFRDRNVSGRANSKRASGIDRSPAIKLVSGCIHGLVFLGRAPL